VTYDDSEPDWLHMSAWQEVDDQHPSDEGIPVYRAVYKTLRLVVPPASLNWPNLVIRFGHGTVRHGEARVRNALEGRRPGEYVVAEFGKLVPAEEPGMVRYQPDPPGAFEFAGHEEEWNDVFYVEFLLHTTAESHVDRLAEGRRRLARLQTMLDLQFGPRLLGLQLAEELGRLFEDGHVSREIASPRLGHEWQLDVAAIEQSDIEQWGASQVQRQMGLSAEARQRLELACNWYWAAIHSGDPVNEYLQLFFVMEALWMPDTANVRPVRERFAQALGGVEGDWAQVVGLHAGRRSRLVHGNDNRSVEAQHVDELRDLVRAMLAIELGVPLDRPFVDRVKERAGVA
jgi:hypothetical protein